MSVEKFQSDRNFVVVSSKESPWGNCRLKDIAAVLDVVRRQFEIYFGSETMRTKGLTVKHWDKDHPECRRHQNTIYLTVCDSYWCNFSYQFSHELCHYIIPGFVPQNLRWLEETICELASYFFLRRCGVSWKTRPPYPNWRSYAGSFFSYVELDMQKARPLDDPIFKDKDILFKYLENHPLERDLNSRFAIMMLPVFELNPQLWRSIPFLGRIPGRQSLKDSFDSWCKVSGEDQAKLINQLYQSVFLS